MTLIGREHELTLIEEALRDLERGDCRVLAVSGEPGIGKTRLLSELSARGSQRGMTLLAGRGTELEREVPFGALVEALDDFLGSLEPRRLAALGERLPYLASVFPSVGAIVEAHVVPAAERYHLHRAIRGLLQELAAKRPVILVLDDVHWADQASLETIAHLLRRSPEAPVLVALAFRSGLAPPILRAALGIASRNALAEPLTLETLTEPQAATLLAGEPAADRRRIILESGGNPFYIEQLNRARAGPTVPVLSPAQAAGAEPVVQIPAAVAAAIEEELGHLPAQARRMLEGAAVAGEPFDPELAAETAGLAPALALVLLDELVALDLVRAEAPPRLFRFRHPIVRRAVYDSLAPGRRLAAHRRAAEELTRVGASASRRAHHIALSARPRDDAAITALVEAASQAAGSAPASAARWLTVALSLLPSDDLQRRLELLSPLAQVQVAAGALADARETLAEISAGLPAGSGWAWSRAVATLASVELELGRHSGARRRLEAALEAIGDQSSPQAVPLLLALAIDVAYQTGNFKRAVQLGRRALDAAVTAGEPQLRVAARSVLAALLASGGEVKAAIGCAKVASAELDALSDEQVSYWLEAPYRLGIAETFLERFEDGAGHLQRGVAVALSCGSSQFIVPTRTFLAYGLFQLGRIEDALRVADAAVESGRLLRMPAGLAWALSIASLVWSVVDADQALRLGEEAISVLADVDDSIITDATYAHCAWACANAGEHQQCIDHMQMAGAPGFDRFEPGRRCLFAATLVGSMLVVGRGDEAREWAVRAESFASGLGLQVAEAAARRGRALILLADGDPASAAELARHAANAAAQGGAQIEAARSELVAARALAAAGHRDQAVQQLRATRTIMAERGARRLEQETASELRALGAAAPAPVPRRPGDAGSTQLSRREREVATLVAAGKSNREIARILYLSPKTIEGHMRRIFAKLDVSSRAQVAATIARQES